eukprot:scaffold678766_cov31-Prasinocladus_malaysianus.AAC.1
MPIAIMSWSNPLAAQTTSITINDAWLIYLRRERLEMHLLHGFLDGRLDLGVGGARVGGAGKDVGKQPQEALVVAIGELRESRHLDGLQDK